MISRQIESLFQDLKVSVMMFVNTKKIKKLRDEIDNRGYKDKLMLAVGGSIFNLQPELVKTVGGDGTAPNALSAVKLFEELSLRSKLWKYFHIHRTTLCNYGDRFLGNIE